VKLLLEQLSFLGSRDRDPFDRMIVVHAMRHGLSIVSADAAFDLYGLTGIGEALTGCTAKNKCPRGL
jgi:PIN domain nuclease of toxin-antitoxin system